MDILINERGELLLGREDDVDADFKQQLCPYQQRSNVGGWPCGDHCPLFGVPVLGKGPENMPDYIDICNMRRWAGEISDWRGMKAPKK